MTQTDRRRRFQWRDGTRSVYVPLWHSHEQGDWIEGVVRVPTRLANSQPHTNERGEFDRLMVEQLRRWTEWREARGWTMTTRPKITGPFDPPTRTAVDEPDPDEKWYFAIARFRRSEPLFVRLDDFLHIQRKAEQFGVTDQGGLPWNRLEKGDSGWVDPVRYAQERREKLGIDPAEYAYW